MTFDLEKAILRGEGLEGMLEAVSFMIERPVDRILVSVKESMRSFTHEAWQYASQVTNGTSVFLLGCVRAGREDRGSQGTG